jgi:ketosteroid isomerase-like protein
MNMTPKRISELIIKLESDALTRWGKGDPSGFLELCAPDVVYFDPGLATRIDGLEALTRYYELLRGTIFFDSFKLLNPKVQVIGDAAVLTFNYISNGSDGKPSPWNCTEVYRKTRDRWLIMQTHWSFTKSKRA